MYRRNITRSRELLPQRCTLDHGVPVSPARTYHSRCRVNSMPICADTRRRGRYVGMTTTTTSTTTPTRLTWTSCTTVAVASAVWLGRQPYLWTQQDDQDDHCCKVIQRVYGAVSDYCVANHGTTQLNFTDHFTSKAYRNQRTLQVLTSTLTIISKDMYHQHLWHWAYLILKQSNNFVKTLGFFL